MNRPKLRNWLVPFAATAVAFAMMIPITPAFAVMPAEWTAPHFRDHPLVGTIWTGKGEKRTIEDLKAAIGASKHVAVGETHPNADHHVIQAAIIDLIAKTGRKPVVVMEMVPRGLNEQLTTFLAGESPDSAKLGDALNWRDRGWPAWEIYRPIADAVIDNSLSMRAGDLDRSLIRRIGREGTDVLSPQDLQRFGLDQPLPRDLHDDLIKVLSDAHCGYMPDKALGPMLNVQRARDGSLADAMLEAHSGDGSVLIAGAGHVRRDWGVPSVVQSRDPDEEVLAIALVEVAEPAESFSEYQDNGLAAFDYVVFTPRAEIKDHCAELAKHFGEKKPEKAE